MDVADGRLYGWCENGFGKMCLCFFLGLVLVVGVIFFAGAIMEVHDGVHHDQEVEDGPREIWNESR